MAIRTSLIGTAARLPTPAGALAAVFASLALLSLAFSSPAQAQTDPGVRGGAINGQPGATTTSPLPLASVTANTPTGIQDFFTEFVDHRLISFGARFDHFVPQLVGLDQQAAEVGQRVSDEGFAASQATGETYAEHA